MYVTIITLCRSVYVMTQLFIMVQMLVQYFVLSLVNIVIFIW